MKMSKFKPNEKWIRGSYNVLDVTSQCANSLNTQPVVVFHRKGRSNNSVAGWTYHIQPGSAEMRRIKMMNLDEMLEASKVIQMGIVGEELPIIKSPNAQRCAETILALNKRGDTKPVAVRMIDNLNAQIIRTNKKTTNIAESKRLYKNLMREK